ncbi:hypothetical protein BH20ACT24_BH20ACT24_16180 [soil metagenome]
MGERGPAGRGQGHRRKLIPLPAPGPARREPPPPPSGLSESSRGEWDTFWEGEVAFAVRDADLPALRRLWQLRDEWDRCFRAFRRRRFVEGSTGQPVISPAAGELHRLEGDIRALESQFGLTPASRLRLGLSGVRMTATLEELTRQAGGEAEDTDPRVEDHSER